MEAEYNSLSVALREILPLKELVTAIGEIVGFRNHENKN
jgi:hypothetical protein